MALKAKSFGRFAIGCDDPFQRKCYEESVPRYSEDGARSKAKELDWFYSAKTGKDACPACVELQKDVIKSKVALGKIPKEKADDFADPFSAEKVS